jgi:hypothetical protein
LPMVSRRWLSRRRACLVRMRGAFVLPPRLPRVDTLVVNVTSPLLLVWMQVPSNAQ